MRPPFGPNLDHPAASARDHPAAGARDGAGGDLSVVVVLHDSGAELPALLASLRRHLPGAQVIVVDADSSDHGPEIAADAGCELVVLGANPGFGAANNAGVARARRPITVLLNPDCELLDARLTVLAAAATATDALVVPRLLGADGRPQASVHPLPGTAGALLPALVHPPVLPAALRDRMQPWRATTPRTAGWAIAACVVARTTTLRALGPFDPGIFLFFEDLDLCLRARAGGVPTVLVPSVAVRHTGGHSTERAYDGEPHDLLARRRRAVVRTRRGRWAARLDEVAQALTFATRLAARALLRRPRDRERAQLRAQLRRR